MESSTVNSIIWCCQIQWVFILSDNTRLYQQTLNPLTSLLLHRSGKDWTWKSIWWLNWFVVYVSAIITQKNQWACIQIYKSPLTKPCCSKQGSCLSDFTDRKQIYSSNNAHGTSLWVCNVSGYRWANAPWCKRWYAHKKRACQVES